MNDIDFNKKNEKKYDCIVIAVAHKFYMKNYQKIKELLKPKAVFYDIKGKFNFRENNNFIYCSL